MGRVAKIVKIATDVTAEVKANQMLRDAVDQAQKVTAAAQEGDLAAHPDGRQVRPDRRPVRRR